MTEWSSCLDEAVAWVAQSYPDEGCGLILQTGDDFRFLACDNLANKYHAVDPQTYPRTARTFYIIDPMEFVRAEDRGERVAVIVHSHADVGDYFSDEDIAGALMPRFDPDEPIEPAHPGADFLVVSVREAGPDHATLFSFDASSERGFVAVWESDL